MSSDAAREDTSSFARFRVSPPRHGFVGDDGACACGPSGIERDRHFVLTYRQRIVSSSILPYLFAQPHTVTPAALIVHLLRSWSSTVSGCRLRGWLRRVRGAVLGEPLIAHPAKLCGNHTS